MTARFVSKRDAWLVVLLWASSLLMLWAAVATWNELSPAARAATAVACVGTAALVLWILYGTDYTLDGEWLRIRSGPFRYRVPVGEIVEVRPSRNPLSSPACSLDRLLVRWGRGRRILISPEDKDGFLRALVTAAPQLRLDGGSARAAAQTEPPSSTSSRSSSIIR